MCKILYIYIRTYPDLKHWTGLTSDSSTADSSTNASTTKVRQLKTAVSSTKVRQPKSRIRQPRGSSTKKVGFVNQKRRIHQPRFVHQGLSTKNTGSSTKDSSTKRLDSSTKNGGFINQGSSTKNTDSSTKDSSTKRLDFVNQKRRIRQPSFVTLQVWTCVHYVPKQSIP